MKQTSQRNGRKHTHTHTQKNEPNSILHKYLMQTKVMCVYEWVSEFVLYVDNVTCIFNANTRHMRLSD